MLHAYAYWSDWQKHSKQKKNGYRRDSMKILDTTKGGNEQKDRLYK